MARALARTIRERSIGTLALIFEPDPDRLLATLLTDDWTLPLEEPRIRFAVGPDPIAAFDAAVPEATRPLLQLGIGGGLGLVSGDEPAYARGVHQRLVHAAASVRQDFDRAAAAQKFRRGGGPPSLPDGPWRIGAAVSAETTAIKHLAASIAAAARRAGHDADVLVSDTATDPFSVSTAAAINLQCDPDLVLGFLRPGKTVVPWRDDFPSLVLVSSNPGLLPVETFDWSRRDLVVVTEPSFTAPYEQLGLEPLVRPLATDLPDLAEIDRTEAVECDVLIVGNIPSGLPKLPGDSPNLRRLLGELAEDWIAHPTVSLAEVLGTTNIAGDPGFMNAVRLALGYEATRLRRIRSAIALAESGLRVRIHGEESWEAALAGTAAASCWHGWLPSGPIQFAAFRRATVALSINSFATPDMLNMRSLEIPAAGGVLLSDDRPALHRGFEVGTEALAFRRIEELPDLVRDLTSNPDRRDSIAAAGRRRVERDHSWDSWWMWAEARLRERFPPRP